MRRYQYRQILNANKRAIKKARRIAMWLRNAKAILRQRCVMPLLINRDYNATSSVSTNP